MGRTGPPRSRGRRSVWRSLVVVPGVLALAACGPTGLFAGPPDTGGMTVPRPAPPVPAPPVVAPPVVAPPVLESPAGPVTSGSSPTTGTAPPSPSATPTTAAPSPRPSVSCPPPLGPASTIRLTVTPGVGSAVVSWAAPLSRDSDIRGWLVAAVREDQPTQAPVRWQKVTAGAGCRTLTTRLTGLARGHVHDIWLEAVVGNAETGAPQPRQVGTEPAVGIR